MNRRTKIVATIGPASGSPEMIAILLDKGVNVFRLNFSHGSADGHRSQAKIIRQVCSEKQIYAAILGDLQGPKIRIGRGQTVLRQRRIGGTTQRRRHEGQFWRL